MTEKQLIKTVNILLTIAFVSLFYGLLCIEPHRARVIRNQPDKEIIVEIEVEKYKYPEYDLKYQYYENWYKPNSIVHETVTETSIEYEYLGYYFLTAYSPQETGSWYTASGTTLHRADYDNRLIEPTTCAIDRNLHRFGDLFYIPAFDRVFVAEDTGSAVKGYHLDLGYTDLESVWSFPTGYYEVYSARYVYTDKDIEYYGFEKVRGIIHIAFMRDHY